LIGGSVVDGWVDVSGSDVSLARAQLDHQKKGIFSAKLAYVF